MQQETGSGSSNIILPRMTPVYLALFGSHTQETRTNASSR
jgi:hypothetical protein